MKILITGGAGFLGSNLAKFFKDRGDDVVVLDNLSRPGSELNAKWLNLPLIKKNIRQIEIEDIKGFDIIYHLAGQVTVTESVKDPYNDFIDNAYSTHRLLEVVRHGNPKCKIVFSSTNKVYGEIIDNLPVSESHPLDFKSPYGCSKGCADQYVLDYAKTFKMWTCVLRQSCIYGQRQFGMEGQGWISWFVDRILKGKQLTIYGNGKQVRDILHVDDWVQVAVKCLSAKSGEVFNVGGGALNSISLTEAVDYISRVTSKPADLIYAPTRVSDQPFYVSNIKKANDYLGWKPKINTEKGIKLLIKWQESIS